MQIAFWTEKGIKYIGIQILKYDLHAKSRAKHFKFVITDFVPKLFLKPVESFLFFLSLYFFPPFFF